MRESDGPLAESPEHHSERDRPKDQKSKTASGKKKLSESPAKAKLRH